MDAPTILEPVRRHPDDVRDAVNRCAISKADLARRAGLHPNSLLNMDSPQWSPRWLNLVALCEAAEAIKAERA